MSYQQERLAAIADAIREKEGTAEPIAALDFAERILALESGTQINDGDTGWVTLELINGFTPYEELDENIPKVRRIGKKVYFKGIISPPSNNTLGSDTVTVFCRIPIEYCPDEIWRGICQGATTYIWLLQVSENGSASATRYRSTSSYSDPSATADMPFALSWCTKYAGPESDMSMSSARTMPKAMVAADEFEPDNFYMDGLKPAEKG